jgi:hypothetical protein
MKTKNHIDLIGCRHPGYRRIAAVLAATSISVLARAAFASSAGMPWEGPIQRLVQSLTGPVAKGLPLFLPQGARRNLTSGAPARKIWAFADARPRVFNTICTDLPPRPPIFLAGADKKA